MEEKPQDWVKPYPVPFLLSYPLPPASVGSREDTGSGKGQSGILFSFWAVGPSPAEEKCLESLFLRLGSNEQLLVSEVPPGCHVECHVG